LIVFVLDKQRKQPLMPCSEKRARLLLTRGRAVVVRRYPFTIRLKDRVGGEVQPVRVKIDPGSKTTGIAVVTDEDGNKPAKVLCLFELSHRGRQISESLTARRAFRRRRRGANLRYRAPRFDNRREPQGWVAPSLQHRIDTCLSWVERLRRVVAVTGIAVERMRFDTQLLEKPEISGVEYQRGMLAGSEVCEYLLEKFDRASAYCGACNVPVQIEPIVSRARGGFPAGDMVRGEVPNGKTAGVHVGRVSVRASGSFRVGNADALNAKYCKILHRADGHGYGWRPALPPRPERRGFQRRGF
jgi:hypothetical protein